MGLFENQIFYQHTSDHRRDAGSDTGMSEMLEKAMENPVLR